MVFLEHKPVPVAECPVCGHPPIHHMEDGPGATCMVCSFMALKAVDLGLKKVMPICTRRFPFKLSLAERIQAMAGDKSSYEQERICAICNCHWKQHWGFLCVTGDSTFVPVLDYQQPFLVTH